VRGQLAPSVITSADRTLLKRLSSLVPIMTAVLTGFAAIFSLADSGWYSIPFRLFRPGWNIVPP